MIQFIVTCGRGLEKHVEDEIKEKIENIGRTMILDDGKIYFEIITNSNLPLLPEKTHVTDDDVDDVRSETKTVIELSDSDAGRTLRSNEEINENLTASNMNQGTNLNTLIFTSSLTVQDRLTLSVIFDLKLPEKLFLLLQYNKYKPKTAADNKYKPKTAADNKYKPKTAADSDEIISVIEKISWKCVAELSKYLQDIRTSQSTNLRCASPISCPASSKRSQICLKRRQHRQILQTNRIKSKKQCTDNQFNNLTPKHGERNDSSASMINLLGDDDDDDDDEVTHDTHTHGIFQLQHYDCKNVDNSSDNKIINESRRDGDEVSSSISDDTVFFRVSCRITGARRSTFNTFITCKKITENIQSQTENWKVISNKDSDTASYIDIYVNITDRHLFIGSCLVRKPLSLRPYIRHICLRSTLCHLMLRLAEVKDGDVLLDPMCGIGSILAEAVHCFKLNLVVGCDIDCNQLKGASCNLSSCASPVELLLTDVACLSFRKNSIDAIVCDFPFGHQYKSKGGTDAELLSSLFSLCALGLKTGGYAVVLLSVKQEELVQAYRPTDGAPHSRVGVYMELLSTTYVSLGRTPAYVCKLKKNID